MIAGLPVEPKSGRATGRTLLGLLSALAVALLAVPFALRRAATEADGSVDAVTKGER